MGLKFLFKFLKFRFLLSFHAFIRGIDGVYDFLLKDLKKNVKGFEAQKLGSEYLFSLLGQKILQEIYGYPKELAKILDLEGRKGYVSRILQVLETIRREKGELKEERNIPYYV